MNHNAHHFDSYLQQQQKQHHLTFLVTIHLHGNNCQNAEFGLELVFTFVDNNC